MLRLFSWCINCPLLFTACTKKLLFYLFISHCKISLRIKQTIRFLYLNSLLCSDPAWIGRFCSQWRLSTVPSYSYQSRVQHSCTIHWCITSLLPNSRLGQTQFFSVQLYFVALFLLMCKCLKQLIRRFASISEKKTQSSGTGSLLELLWGGRQEHSLLVWCVWSNYTTSLTKLC